MRSRACACLVFSTVLCSYLGASEVDPRAVFEALRDQMKELHTLRAEYMVDAIYDSSRKPQTAQLTYIKDDEKFHIVETRTDPNGREVLRRFAYDGLDIKAYGRDSADAGQTYGGVFPSSHRTIGFTDNDLTRAAGYTMVGPGADERYAEARLESRGTEFVDGYDCQVVVSIMPFIPGHDAYDYFWIEIEGSRCMLRRNRCLIDDKRGMVLYERQFAYDSSARYPFPTEIKYRRYDIDAQGYRSLDYEKLIRIQSVQINEPIDPDAFVFAFPKGTSVNAAPPTVSEAELRDARPWREPDPSERPFDPNSTQPDPRTEFSFDPNEGFVLVPVQFGPEARDFVLDTGCTSTMFDLSFRPQLGASGRIVGAMAHGGPTALQAFNAPRAFIGPFNIADCNEVVCANLSTLALVLGRDVDGTIGMDVLRSHVVRIDFDERRIPFLDGQENRHDWGQPFPLTYRENGLPQVTLNLRGIGEHDFAIDTGCATTGTLTEEAFDRVVAEGGLLPVPTVNLGVASTVESSQCRVGSLRLGSFEYRDLIFAKGAFSSLGLGFLSRHTVTFDFPHDRLYLKKAEGFDKYDETGMCGLALIRPDGKTVVHTVYDNEPAAKAGIEARDVILKLQGRDVETYTTWEIGQLCRSGDGKEIIFTIQRGDEVKDIMVVLERRI